MGFMGQKGEESTAVEQPDSVEPTALLKDKEVEDDGSVNDSAEVANEEIKKAGVDAEPMEEIKYSIEEQKDNTDAGQDEEEGVSLMTFVEASEQNPEHVQTESSKNFLEEETPEEESRSALKSEQPAATSSIDQVERTASVPKVEDNAGLAERVGEQKAQKDVVEVFSAQDWDMSPEGLIECIESSASDSPVKTGDAGDVSGNNLTILQHTDAEASELTSNL